MVTATVTALRPFVWQTLHTKPVMRPDNLGLYCPVVFEVLLLRVSWCVGCCNCGHRLQR